MSDQNLDCSKTQKCETSLPMSMVVRANRSLPTLDSDCSKIIILLTDEKGKVDVSDDVSDDFLSVEDRKKVITSIDSASKHFKKCSRTYFELEGFFGNSPGVMVRPQQITVVYFDRDGGEKMLDAILDITKCDDCFSVITHVALDSEGNSTLMDTADQLDLAAWAAFNLKMFSAPTHNYDKIKSTSDTDSNPALSKVNGDWSTAYIATSDICVDELDDNCEKTGNKVDTIGVEHIGLGAIMASISTLAPLYTFTIKFKPKGGVGIPNSRTSYLDMSESIAATGVDVDSGMVLESSPHHVNLYHNIQTRKMIIEGVTSTGLYIDDAMQRIHVKKEMTEPLLDLLVDTDSVSRADLTLLEMKYTSVIRGFEKQGFISKSILDLSNVDNVIKSGPGWYLSRVGGDDNHTVSRMSPEYEFCYIPDGSVHFVNLHICKDGSDLTIKEEA